MCLSLLVCLSLLIAACVADLGQRAAPMLGIPSSAVAAGDTLA